MSRKRRTRMPAEKVQAGKAHVVVGVMTADGERLEAVARNMDEKAVRRWLDRLDSDKGAKS